MSPRAGLIGKRIVVELVIPDDVIGGAVIDTVERRAKRVIHAIARTANAGLKRGVFTAGKDILLAELVVFLHFSSEEARLMLDGVRAVLSESKMGMDDLVYVQICCSDVSLFETFNAVYRQYFSGDLPARAFIGSGPLLFGARFEIVGIAQRR